MLHNSSYFPNETTTWNQFSGLSGSISQRLSRVNSWFVTPNKYWHDKTIKHFELNFLKASQNEECFWNSVDKKSKGIACCVWCLPSSTLCWIIQWNIWKSTSIFYLIHATGTVRIIKFVTNTALQAYGELTNGDLAMIFALGGLFQGIGFLIGR